MTHLMYGIALVASMVGGYLLVGSSFLPETRLMLGGIYLLIAVVASLGFMILRRLER
jgi:hypothetical protein